MLMLMISNMFYELDIFFSLKVITRRIRTGYAFSKNYTYTVQSTMLCVLCGTSNYWECGATQYLVLEYLVFVKIYVKISGSSAVPIVDRNSGHSISNRSKMTRPSLSTQETFLRLKMCELTVLKLLFCLFLLWHETVLCGLKYILQSNTILFLLWIAIKFLYHMTREKRQLLFNNFR